MHLPKFEYLRPASVEEATQLLKEYGPRARLVAGGTDLFPRMKYGLIRPEVLVGLKGIPVKVPTVTQNGDLHVDALTSLADVARSPVIGDRAPLLKSAALSVGSNQIRHMGTLGGNLCLENRCQYYNQTHTFQFVEPCFKRGGGQCYLIRKGKRCSAAFSADTAPALISLGALVNVTGPETQRQVPLENIYTADALKPLGITGHEVVTEVIIPGQKSRQGMAFIKFSLREGLEFAVLNVAVVLRVEEDGVSCREARVTVGAVSTAPLRMFRAEEAVRGQHLSKGLFDRVAQLGAAGARLCPRLGFSAKYLRECLRVQICRALILAAQRVSRDKKKKIRP
ncbi:MAG: hypothetical protein GTO13_16740 [Proteobacteria bacterium]|nr:hypothetical protein [Pseudomonadota bacterium]